MKTDLTKKPGSISYEYLQVMPKVYELQGSNDLSASEKRDEILIVAIQALNNAKASKDAYERKRNDLLNALTDNDLIRVMQEVIKNGQNYDDGRG